MLLAAGLLSVHPAPARGGERLVYAVVYKGEAFEAAFTEIYSLDPETGKRRLLFSDEKSPIVLLQRLYVFHFPVTGGGRIFAHAALRGAPRAFPGNGDLYEIRADGSGRYRRIGRVEGEESLGELIADPTGTRVGYIERRKQRQYLYLHSVSSGAVVSRVEVTGMLLDCHLSAVGWDPVSGRLYLTAEAGESDVTSEASSARAGTYLFDPSGSRRERIGSPPPLPGFLPPESARMIGILPDGGYVFETTQLLERSGRGPARFSFAVVRLDPATGRSEEIGFRAAAGRPPGGRLMPMLAPSGLYLAGATPPGSSKATTQEIWVKSLRGGREKMLASVPCAGAEGPFLGLVGWLPP